MTGEWGMGTGEYLSQEPLRIHFGLWVAGVEWRVLRATSPQTGDAWGLATRSSRLDPSHPCRKAELVLECLGMSKNKLESITLPLHICPARQVIPLGPGPKPR